MIAENLANDIISVTGVKMVSPNQNRRWVSLRPWELQWRKAPWGQNQGRFRQCWRETLKNYPPLPSNW